MTGVPSDSTQTRAQPPVPWQSLPEVVAQQRRSVRLIITAQLFGSFGVGASASVGVLLVEQVIQSDALAGIARTGLTLGAAVLGIPLAYLATHRGRRISLAAGWGLGGLGAVLLVLAAVLANPVLVVAGLLLFGSGTAAGLQTRFSSTDLALPSRRGRTLSMVVWAGMFGSVLGPNLGVPGEVLAGWMGLPPLAGAFVIAAVFLAVAAVFLLLFLRPDPLLTAQAYQAHALPTPDAMARAAHRRISFRTVLATVWRIPAARFALVAVVISHVSMVSLMTMTPVHMNNNGAELSFIGITISVHVLGMFAFAPLVGLASDRFGPVTVIVAGQLIFLGSAVVVFLVGAQSTMVMPSLFLLGLGWSCGTVPGAVLISSSVPADVRVPTQGVMDTSMNMVAAVAAFISGPAYVGLGFGGLAYGIILVSLAVVALSFTLPGTVWRFRRASDG